jgi:hypothetical protein
MSPFLLVTVVAAILMGLKLTDIYVGGKYVCPSCGARSEGRHSRECPWSRPPSG